MSTLGERYHTAFVTGASAGLGRAFTEMLLGEGVRVWGTARDPARLPARAGLSPVALDLTDPAGVATAFRTAEDAAGGFDLVINNAGFGMFGPFVERDFGDWQRQLEAMLTQTMQLSHLALRGMLARNRGALVNISSLAAEFPLPFMSSYNTVKAGLAAFSESLMVEVRGTGVIVIDFRPGDYHTDFNQAMYAISKPPAEAGFPMAARQQRVWKVYEADRQAGPKPQRAAADLRRALRQGRSATVRSGTFFQSKLAPLLARLVSLRVRRAIMARYFGSS
jgi:short-subunit dehydrogenase